MSGASILPGDPAAARPPLSARARDAALLFAGAAFTVLAAVAAAGRPAAATGALALFAAAAVVALNRRHLARLRLGVLLAAGLIALPPLALLGPAFALPAAPQAFAYRLGLAAVLSVGATYLVVRREPLRFAGADIALPIVLWAAWLCVTLLWARDKLAGISYLAVVLTMLLAMGAAAAGGGSRRRLRGLGILLILAYAFILGFSILEARLGIRLPTSRLLTTVTSQTYAVTSVFHNQNDLATYIALCWPFMLCAVFFTRRPGWLTLDVLFMLMGAAAFVRTGSRSSLVAAGISTLAAVPLLAHLGPRLSTRTGKAMATLVAVVLVGGAGYLLFNDSQSDMLRQFRLETLIKQATSGQGSGEIRTSLNDRGLAIAGRSYLLGAGPGQAEGIISSGTDALGISNLHNWWLETYADGGLAGFALHACFFFLMIGALWRLARHDPDPLVRYLASGTALALIGFTVGALGPSSSVSFAPMWVLYGLGLAVISRSRLAAADGALPTAPDAEAAR